MNDREKLLAESFEYMQAIRECKTVTSVPELLANAAYVYLGRMARIKLALKILQSVFKK